MTTNSPLTDLDLDEIDARAAHLYEYADLPDDAEILAGTEVPALVAEVRRLRAAAVVPAADRAADELTAEEARDLVDELGTDLYRAQDALAFVGECCDIADRDGRPVTTADVREWLKGARCGRQLLADAADRDALRDRIAEAAMRLGRPRWDADDLADAVLGVLPAPADRATVLLEAADRYQGFLDNADTSADPRYWTGIRDMVLGLRRMAAEATPVGASDAPANGTGAPVAAETPQPETCAHCGKHVRLITGTLTAWWVHDPGGNTVCHPQEAANSPRATPAAPAQPGKDTEADA